MEAKSMEIKRKKQAKEKNNGKNLEYSFHKDTAFLNSFLTKFHGASAS